MFCFIQHIYALIIAQHLVLTALTFSKDVPMCGLFLVYGPADAWTVGLVAVLLLDIFVVEVYIYHICCCFS